MRKTILALLIATTATAQTQINYEVKKVWGCKGYNRLLLKRQSKEKVSFTPFFVNYRDSSFTYKVGDTIIVNTTKIN